MSSSKSHVGQRADLRTENTSIALVNKEMPPQRGKWEVNNEDLCPGFPI